jgi:hypothetical protein
MEFKAFALVDGHDSYSPIAREAGEGCRSVLSPLKQFVGPINGCINQLLPPITVGLTTVPRNFRNHRKNFYFL